MLCLDGLTRSKQDPIDHGHGAVTPIPASQGKKRSVKISEVTLFLFLFFLFFVFPPKIEPVPDRRPPVLLLCSGPFCPLHSADTRAKILQALTADCRCSSALTDKWVLMLADPSSHCWQQSKPAASPEGALQQAVLALAKAHACCCLMCHTVGTQLPIFQLSLNDVPNPVTFNVLARLP